VTLAEGPRVAALVVALGEDPRLESCLAALDRALPPGSPVLVVQNGVEGPGPALPEGGPRFLRRSGNPGFAAAFDEGFARLEAPYILSVNPDCRVEPSSVLAAAERLDRDPGAAAVAFRLLRPEGDLLDSAGIRLGFLRRASDRGQGLPARGRYLEEDLVDAPCLAAALLRRSALLDVRDLRGEVLDSRFFAYKDDVDLGWRLRRRGHRVVYLPGAVAIHDRGWREGGRGRIPAAIRRASLRNRWFMILRNESVPDLLLRLVPYLILEVATLLWCLLRERELLPAWREGASGLAESWRRRKFLADGLRADPALGRGRELQHP
jgi:GT2 family glycosyltransferase